MCVGGGGGGGGPCAALRLDLLFSARAFSRPVHVLLFFLSPSSAPTRPTLPPSFSTPPQKAVNDLGLGLRVAETNSAVDGGQGGVSEVFGAALWTADAALEFARAGATGVHMHWGFGGDPRTGGPAYVGVMTQYRNGNPDDPFPSVHAPW